MSRNDPFADLRNNGCPDELLRFWADTFPFDERKFVAEIESCPRDVFEKLASDPSPGIRNSLAQNPKCPPEILRRLSRTDVSFFEDEWEWDFYEFLDSVIKHPLCPADVWVELAADKSLLKDGWHGPDLVMSALARSAFPREELRRFAADRNENRRAGVASNETCPPEILFELAKDSSELVRKTVSRNPSCPPGVLRELAKDPSDSVRAGVSWNPSCPPRLLNELANDPSEKVRSEVVQNQACPKSVLTALIERVDEKRRLWLVRTADLPPANLKKLASDKSVEVRRALAEKPQSPPDVLLTLAHDVDDRVRKFVADNESCPEEAFSVLATCRDGGFRRTIAAHKNCPEKVLAELACDEEYYVRREVALNLNCPEKVLGKLARHEWVPEEVADHTNCSEETLLLLASVDNCRPAVAGNDKSSLQVLRKCLDMALDEWEITALICHPNATEEIRRKSFERMREVGVRNFEWAVEELASRPDCPPDFLVDFSQWKGSKNAKIRFAAISNQSFPVKALRKSAEANVWSIRAAVATNRSCPADVLGRLLEDNEGQVIVAALQNSSCPSRGQDEAVRRVVASGSEAAKKRLISLWNEKGTAPVDLIETLATDKSPALRKWAASKDACPQKVLASLAQDSDKSVRAAVAGNVACPSAVFAMLTADPDLTVRKAAGRNLQHLVNVGSILNNPQNSAWLQDQLLNAEQKSPGITAAVANGDYLFPAPRTDKAAQGASLLGRIIALSQHDANPKLLARSSGYRDWRLRMTIARNPNTPAHILKKLARDSHRVVAAMAKATIEGKSEARSRIYRQAAKLKGETSADLDLAPLDRGIGERLRVAALEEQKKHFTREYDGRFPYKDIDNAIDARVADRLGGPFGPWGAWLPLSSWWNSTDLAPGLVQEHWQKRLGKAAPDLTDLLKQSPAKDERNLLHLIARSENCPEKLFNEFYSGEDAVLKEAIAGNGACPAALLTELANSRSEKIKVALATNPNCPQRIIEDLASSSYHRVVFALMERRKKLPRDVWRTMARSKNELVRQAVAESKKCPLEVLELLVNDRNSWVRETLARSSEWWGGGDAFSRLPVHLQEKLAADKSSDVREGVAENPNAPDHLVEKLAKDRSADVRGAAARNSSKLAAETLMRLAKDKSKEVRENLAQESDIPLEILKLLAKDKNGEVRASVADNPKTTVEMLELLSKDRNAEVREYVARHERATAKILEQLARR